MKNRKLAELISIRLSEKTPLIQVVVGPRQVGKTTALKAAIGTYSVYETADFPTPLPYTVIEQWWQKALQHPSRILAIDEIQKIPGWTEIVKRLWDASPHKIKMIVTGSSALLIEKGLKETLAGRYELIRAEHWNYQEAKEIFGLSLKQFVEFGCYPGAISFMSHIERWGNYVRDSIVEPALGRDLLQLHPVEYPALLRQLFGVAVSLPGQTISLQKLQGQLQGKGAIPTIQNYLKLLGDTFLVTGIEKYHKSAFKMKKSSPKLIIHDNGLVRAFERPIHDHLLPERWGRYLENLVGARFIEAGWDTFYWKDRNLDVDFVVLGPENQKWAIEVKSSKTSLDDLRGLLEFCKVNKEFEPCLVSSIEQKFQGIRTLELEELLSISRRYS